MTCPCGSDKNHSLCCEPFHNHSALPSTAEQLMRSRYCAFIKKDIDYLIATLHPSKRKPDDKQALENTFNTTQWLSLRIIRGQKDTVEFCAFFQDFPIGQLHERSHFCFEDGRWYYLDGEMLPPLKIGRNDPCVCGSGKKTKKCCAHSP